MSTADNAKLNACVQYAFTHTFDPNRAIFVKELNPDFRFVSAYYDPTDGLPVVVIKVVTDKAAQNERGDMHAGAFMLMMDNVTSYSVFADMKFYEFPENTLDSVQFDPEWLSKIKLEMGISRTLKMHRNRAIPCGSTIYVASKMVENTPRSSFTTCMVFSEDGRLLATGQHDKTKLLKAVKAKI